MIRFVCENGVGHTTKILNAETGEDLYNVLAINYGVTITIGHMVTAQAEISMLGADVTAEKTEFFTKHPLTGKYLPLAALEFRDGTRVEFAEDGTPRVLTPAT
ncbi:MAG: hypothetical protein KF735_02265 [Chelatococcus sp.]|uniref:hypothetical protein n=1 Tax=Chelatococcus sp. TaxID=1953771 RepID=UPI0025BA6C14|nr:hypothetical protein [Chelatococcus sp.]MBX3536437.1 hypothetical protein [Chelatococcus sp.]